MPVPDVTQTPKLDPASNLDPAIAARLRRNADGLFAAVVREHGTGEVLMVAWMDDEALHRTLTSGRATYFSRSRREYWVKGATSGHHQYVRTALLDCDGDALLLTVEQVGPACHTGTHSCFTDELPVANTIHPTAGDGTPNDGTPNDRPAAANGDGSTAQGDATTDREVTA